MHLVSGTHPGRIPVYPYPVSTAKRHNGQTESLRQIGNHIPLFVWWFDQNHQSKLRIKQAPTCLAHNHSNSDDKTQDTVMAVTSSTYSSGVKYLLAGGGRFSRRGRPNDLGTK